MLFLTRKVWVCELKETSLLSDWHQVTFLHSWCTRWSTNMCLVATLCDTSRSLRKSTLVYWFCKEKLKTVLLRAKQAQRERGGVAVPILDLGTRRVCATHQPLYSWETDPVPIVQDTGWAGLDGSRKSRSHQGLNPGAYSLQQVTILNELRTDSVCFGTVQTSHSLTLLKLTLKFSGGFEIKRGRVCVRFEDRGGHQLSE